ncbi:MAG TPA: hypothetical protein VK724_19785 [Bryobacteraceae bacterium]|nr:hypothetical protein [Bryobacteraceae bacterium]
MKKRNLALVVGLWAILNFIACGGSGTKQPPSGLKERVLASQGITDTVRFGGLVIINAYNDTLPGIAPLSAGNNPGLMAVSPTRNIAAAFDSGSNAVFAADTLKESSIGSAKIGFPTTSFVIPTSNPLGYAAVPAAVVQGYSFTGAVDAMNFQNGVVNVIAVPSAQTVVSNSNGTQLLVFSSDSDSMTILNPGAASPPVDTSCLSTSTTPNPVCTIVPGFDRPVFAIINGNSAYILNCGAQCGGKQASVAIFDLTTFTITNTINVDGATWALLSNSTLYVAGTSPTNNACTGETTAATTCGRLDTVDLAAGKVTATAVITDGYHHRMDLTNNGQLFVGSYDCTNIGNVNNPSGEVRGCLSIVTVASNSVFIPPDNGDVNGLQGFSSRYVEYVAEGGNLRVYDTLHGDILLINTYLPTGNINIPGYVGDVKAIDFF